MVDADTTSQVLAIRTPQQALVDRATVLSNELHNDAQRAIAACRQARYHTIESVPPDTQRILVVDDDETNLKALKRWLRDVVRYVDVAPSVELGIRAAQKVRYDLIVVDYLLLNGTAKDLIARIRHASLHPLVWVLLISGYLSEHNGRQVAEEIDANDWASKPVTYDILIDKVHRGLAQSPKSRFTGKRT